MSDEFEFEVVDEMDTSEETDAPIIIDKNVECPKKIDVAKNVQNHKILKATEIFNNLKQIFEIEKPSTLLEKNGVIDDFSKKIDDFADKMIAVINTERKRVKEDLNQRLLKAKSICGKARNVFEDLEAFILDTDPSNSYEKHLDFINNMEEEAKALQTLRIVREREVKLPETEIKNIFTKFLQQENTPTVPKKPAMPIVKEKRPIEKTEEPQEIKRPRNEYVVEKYDNSMSRFESSNAEPIIVGAPNIDSLGTPFGKELTGFNIYDLSKSTGAIGATFIRKFGDFDKPMGCDLMKEEVIVCNMNKNMVHFHDLDGTESLTLQNTAAGKNLMHPSFATVLLDSRIIVRDDKGVHVYDEDGSFSFSLDLPPNLKVYGVLPVRSNGGMLGIFAQNHPNYTVFYFDRELKNIVKQVNLKLPRDNRPMVRFTGCLGNTLYLSDMSFDNNVIWICDLQGNVRKVAGTGGKGLGKAQFVQAAGITIDNAGNFLAICSKTSRIMAFKANGEYICDVKFESGPVERPSDISINDDGIIAVTSLKGQVHLLQLISIEQSKKWQSRVESDFSKRGGGAGGRGSRGRGRGKKHSFKR